MWMSIFELDGGSNWTAQARLSIGTYGGRHPLLGVQLARTTIMYNVQIKNLLMFRYGEHRGMLREDAMMEYLKIAQECK